MSSMIKQIEATLSENDQIIIDSEKKQVIINSNGNLLNGYNNLNHNKTSFLIAKSGNTIVNVPPDQKFNIEFKKWVID